jgi:FkbM family methyltransferase
MTGLLAGVRRRGIGATAALTGARVRRSVRRGLVLPVRVPPHGLWMVAWPDVMGQKTRLGSYEDAERTFVSALVPPGATAVDVGAHAGFYTLMLARLVGAGGRVIAYEPSRRERRRLLLNLRLNRLANVTVVPAAVGSEEGGADLHVVVSDETGFTSLAPPGGAHRTRTVPVPVVTIDGSLTAHGVTAAAFLKMDIEGAELPALLGAERLLAARPRPVLLLEASEDRARRFGYGAAELADHLEERGFSLFTLDAEGRLLPAGDLSSSDGNVVAVPEERVGESPVLSPRERHS